MTKKQKPVPRILHRRPQVRMILDGKKFRVVQVTDTLDILPGDLLTKTEARALLGKVGLTVTAPVPHNASHD